MPLRVYFGALVGLFVVAAGAAALYVHVQTRRDGRHAAVRDARYAARTGAVELGMSVAALRDAVRQLAANPRIAEGITHPESCSLAYSTTGPDDRSHVDILAPDGSVACSSRPHEPGQALGAYTGADWVRRAHQGPVFIAPIRDRVTGAQVALRAAPGKGNTIVAGFNDLGSAGPALARLYGGGRPVEFLVTGTAGRQVLVRSLDPAHWVGRPVAGTPFAAGRDGVRRRDVSGRPRLYASVAVPSTDWRFYAGEDEAAALASGSRLERRQLMIILIGLASVLLAAWFIYRRVAQPITRLGAAVRTGGDGAVPSTVPVEGPAEVQSVAQNINGLIWAVDGELTERRRAELELRQVAAIVESSDDAIIGKRLDGTITSWNAGAERMYGYTADEAIGRSLDFLIPPEHMADVRTILERVGRGEHVRTTEMQRIRKDGTRIDVSLTFSPVEDEDGRIVGTSAISQDIGDRKRFERRLSLSEESYRLLFERHPAAMWVFDPATLRFLAVNETTVARYGYSHDEFLAMTIEDIRPPEDRAGLDDAMADPARGRVEAGVWRHLTKGGELIEAAISSHAILFEGHPARVVLAEDVTERRRLEAQLRQSQKMEAIGTLAGGIAHDFNNILTVIRMSAALLRQRTGDEPLVLQIDGAAERAAGLTHQLLAFSRQQVLRPEVTDLNAVVDETLELLKRTLGEHIAIEYECDLALPSILVDRSQLGQVILNLAVNARDAMAGGGTLAIRTSAVELDDIYTNEHAEIDPGSYALLQITDSGSGMDEETKSRAFDPFFTTRQDDGGTGLGLATVYGIVKQSGGHIWIYSEPGMGTTFKIYFPTASEPAAPTAAPGPEHELGGDETILLVEDEDAVRPLIAEALGSYGYTVLEAADGAEALRLAGLHGSSLDLLLTDVVMPGMNGRELAERLTQAHPSLHVVFTSGYPADTIIRHGIATAHADFIEKPYLPADLARKIREALDPPHDG